MITLTQDRKKIVLPTKSYFINSLYWKNWNAMNGSTTKFCFDGGFKRDISFHLILYKANVAEILTFQLNHECGLTKVKDLDILNMSRSIVINRWFMLGFSFLPSFDILWLYFKLHFSSNSSKIFVERVDLIIKKYLLRLNLFLEIILVM